MQIAANDGYYILSKFVMTGGSNVNAAFTLDSQKIFRLGVVNFFDDPSMITAWIQYYPQGAVTSMDLKEADLYSASMDRKTDILTLRFMNVDITCDVRLKLAKDRKSVTVLGLSSNEVVKADITLDTLSNQTRTASNEEEIRAALADKSINKIVIFGTDTPSFAGNIYLDNPLVIDRDIEITTISDESRKIRWNVSDKWNKAETAVITITNGANVTFSNMLFDCRPDNLNSNVLSTYIEVKGASFNCENSEFRPKTNTCVNTLICGEDADIKLTNVTLNNARNGIVLDRESKSSSILQIVYSKFNVDDKLIVSNSVHTTVVLPRGFVEFTNAEGQREWTDDASKIPAAE